MSKTKAGPISADRLKNFIARIERLEEERKAIGGDVRDVYAEAKGVGYDVKTMRKIVQMRRVDVAERDEQEQLIDVYAHALGMVIGDTGTQVETIVREPTDEELEERASRIYNEVERCVSLVEDGALPKIEAIKALIGCSNGKAHKLRRMVEAWIISQTNAIERENPEMKTAPDTPGEGASPRIIQNAGEGALATNEEGCGPESGPDELAAQIPAGLIPQPASAPPQREDCSTEALWEAALASKARIDAMKAGRGVARQGEHRGCSGPTEGTQ